MTDDYIKIISTAILIPIFFTCSSLQGKSDLYILLNDDQSDSIFYEEKDKVYYLELYPHKWQILRYREAREDEADYYQKRFRLSKKCQKDLPNLLDEEGFINFVKSGITRSGDCPKCSWGKYRNIYVIVLGKNKRKSTVFILKRGWEESVEVERSYLYR